MLLRLTLALFSKHFNWSGLGILAQLAHLQLGLFLALSKKKIEGVIVKIEDSISVWLERSIRLLSGAAFFVFSLASVYWPEVWRDIRETASFDRSLLPGQETIEFLLTGSGCLKPRDSSKPPTPLAVPGVENN